MAQEADAAHYMVIPYAEGPKRVAGMLAMLVRTGDMTLPRELVVDRRNPCADAVLDVLVPLYRRVGGMIIERMG